MFCSLSKMVQKDPGVLSMASGHDLWDHWFCERHALHRPFAHFFHMAHHLRERCWFYQLNLTQSISIIESAKSIPNLNTRGSPTRYNFPGIYCKVWLETKNNGVSLDAIEYCVLTRLIHLGILWRPSHPKDVLMVLSKCFQYFQYLGCLKHQTN